MRGDELSTQHSCQNTWKAPLMHFLCKEIKHLKSISGKHLMLLLRAQENNRNIELLCQVTAASTCGPPEKKYLPVLPWDDLSNGWPFYSQGCRTHRARRGTRTMSAASHLLTQPSLSAPEMAGKGHALSWACLGPFDLSFWVSATLGKCSNC